MTKTELIQAVAQRLPKIHVNDVDRVINATLDTIKAEVTAGGEVNLIGFGKFSVKEISARIDDGELEGTPPHLETPHG